jgi:cell division protein ZapA
MPEIDISIGGRNFNVACQDGEEPFLRSAAAMLDAEAQPLVKQMGRLPEARMLLMAALMLADKTSAYEEEIRQLKARLDMGHPEPKAVQIPVIPAHIPETLAEIAARAEALAARIEDTL